MSYQIKFLFSFLYIGLIISTLLCTQACAQLVESEIKTGLKKDQQIEQAINEIVEEDKAPGMVAAIISSEGIIAIASAGERKIGSGVAFTTDDVVHIGSCGKAMTCTMLATLVAEGKLTWETTIVEAIPSLKEIIHSDYHNITLWQILTHRSGIKKNPSDLEEYTSIEIKQKRLAITTDNLQSPAAYETGQFNYSNLGYIIAACMAEQITGLSWEELMEERLFGPLGMTTAGFGNPNSHGSIDQPWGHNDFLWLWWKPSEAYYEEAYGPAGRIYCSIADWAKFISLQLPGPTPILERKYLDKLVEPTGFYAAGWGVTEYDWANGITYTHSGSNEIWYATVLIAPEIDRAFVVATNSCDFSSTPDICFEITNTLVRMELK